MRIHSASSPIILFSASLFIKVTEGKAIVQTYHSHPGQAQTCDPFTAIVLSQGGL